MASRRRDLGRPLLVALCVVALFAVGSESHGLEDFREGNTEATPAMASFFGSKPEAAELPEALDASQSRRRHRQAGGRVGDPQSHRHHHRVGVVGAASQIRVRGRRRGVAVAAVAVVGVAVAVAYVVRASSARRESEVRLGSREPTPRLVGVGWARLSEGR